MARKRRSPGGAPATAAGRAFPLAALAAVTAGVVPALFVLARTPGWNGTPYWPWRYHDTPIAPFLALALLGWAAVYAAWSRVERGGGVRAPLAVLTAVHVGLIFSFTALSSKGLSIVGERVRHPDITSYHTEAERIDSVTDFLAHYPERLPAMIGHAQTHPPGPVLYYWGWNRLFGTETGADAGGLFLGLLAGLAIPLAYAAGRRATGEASAGFAAAALWTPLPGVVLMLGSFDAVYPLVTLAVVALWTAAVEDGDARAAAGCGAALAAGMFFTHSFLVLGAWFVLATAGAVWAAADRRAALRRAGRAVAAGAAAALGLFGLLWATTGYDHLAALRMSMRIQEGLAGAWNRPWRLTVVWDVYDFFLASGWAPAALAALLVLRWARGGSIEPRLRGFAAAALGTLAIVDLSGLLRAETARVWLFLQPLALIAAGAELARHPLGLRAAVVGAVFFALAVLRARVVFL